MTPLTTKRAAWGVAVLVMIGILSLALSEDSTLDAFLGWIVVVLPTAMGVVCAMQALRPPKPEHHRRWSVVFIASGVIISATVLWQQHRQQVRSDAERKVLMTKIDDLQRQVDRSLLQIQNVGVSFLFRVPLEHPALQGYYQRIEKCAQLMRQTNERQCGAHYHFFDLANGGRKTLKDFSISPDSELFPKKQTENIAYLLLSQAGLKIGLSTSFPSYQESSGMLSQPDLSFAANEGLDQPQNFNKGVPYVILYYDLETKEMFIEGTRVPPFEGNWYSNGKIRSIPDLSNVWITLYPTISTPTLTPLGGDTPEWQTLREITRMCSFERVKLFISNGWEFGLTKDELTKIIIDKYGDKWYIGKLRQDSMPPFLSSVL